MTLLRSIVSPSLSSDCTKSPAALSARGLGGPCKRRDFCTLFESTRRSPRVPRTRVRKYRDLPACHSHPRRPPSSVVWCRAPGSPAPDEPRHRDPLPAPPLALAPDTVHLEG